MAWERAGGLGEGGRGKGAGTRRPEAESRRFFFPSFKRDGVGIGDLGTGSRKGWLRLLAADCPMSVRAPRRLPAKAANFFMLLTGTQVSSWGPSFRLEIVELQKLIDHLTRS